MELIFHSCTIRSVLLCELRERERERHFGVKGGCLPALCCLQRFGCHRKNQSDKGRWQS